MEKMTVIMQKGATVLRPGYQPQYMGTTQALIAYLQAHVEYTGIVLQYRTIPSVHDRESKVMQARARKIASAMGGTLGDVTSPREGTYEIMMTL